MVIYSYFLYIQTWIGADEVQRILKFYHTYPQENEIRLNMDGSFFTNKNIVACEGVFRNYLGR
ncbi:uncharacterized protein DS421_16g553520 [Arachis hypogaea]|nr:uncharacterized protein DS421_16g553520 [Arachis hypogaea]